MSELVWRDLLPEACVAVVAREEHWSTRLSEVEERRVRYAVPARRAEFRAGRNAAKVALGTLGAAVPRTIGTGARGQPLWPRGMVGSITHSGGYCAAAVAHRRQCCGLGIDVEPNEPLEPLVRAFVMDEVEMEELAAMSAAAPGFHSCKLLFCAKEAVFKCLFPMTRTIIDFRDIVVRLEPHLASFSASVRERRWARPIRGRFGYDRHYLYAAVAWPSAVARPSAGTGQEARTAL